MLDSAPKALDSAEGDRRRGRVLNDAGGCQMVREGVGQRGRASNDAGWLWTVRAGFGRCVRALDGMRER